TTPLTMIKQLIVLGVTGSLALGASAGAGRAQASTAVWESCGTMTYAIPESGGAVAHARIVVIHGPGTSKPSCVVPRALVRKALRIGPAARITVLGQTWRQTAADGDQDSVEFRYGRGTLGVSMAIRTTP